MSLVIDVAQAVADELQAQSFGQEVTVERLYVPEYELADMASGTRVSVVPKAVAVTTLGRGRLQHDVKIDVAVQRRIEGEDNRAACDALLNLVDEIAVSLKMRRLSAMPETVWVKMEHAAVYSPEHLRQMRQFTSLLTMTYRVTR